MSPELITSIGAAIAAIVGSIFAAKGSSKAKRVEDTLNHRHAQNGEVLPSIGQVLMDTHDEVVRQGVRMDKHCKTLEHHGEKLEELVKWKDGYQGSPWQDAKSINKWVSENDKKIADSACKGCSNFAKSCEKEEQS